MDQVKKKAELVDIILSWQIEDILNENLLKDKVKEIPTRFSSINHYLESFHYPLVEETRAELCSCLVAIASAPYVGIHFKEENDVWELQYGSELGFYCSVSGSEKRLYVPVIGDMILFSTSVPANVSELMSGLSISRLVVVSDAGKGATGYVKARLGVPWSNGTKCIGSSFVAVFLMNVTNASHVWYSLQVDTGDSCANLNLLKKALCYENLVEKACSCSFMFVEDFFDEKLRLKLHCLELNESQVSTIHSVICAIRCNHSCTIQEICGLPGTGKTEVVCLISLIAMRLKCKVLVCAPNLCSLMEIVSRFRKFVGESSNISTAHGISGCNLTEFVAFVGKNKEQVNFTGDITDIHLKQACLIFCTASTLSRLHLLGQISYLDVLVVDRAAQIKECESVVSLQIKGLRHVLLAGNDYELPSAVVSKISESAGFGRSLFRRLGFLCPPKRLLDIQYRMHPSISYFPNVKFFNGQILNGQNVVDKSYEKQYLLEHIYGSYSFLNVADGREVPGENGDNWKNFVEAAVICKILMKIDQACASSCQRPSVGILSPYDAQVQAIQDMVSSRIERKSDFSLWMKAFHKIESSEEDVIIISMVRCNKNGYVGIPSDPHLTSNILTRARKCLWIVGNELTLARGPSIWKDLVLDAKERGCFFQVGEDRQLAGVILNIKQELNQLDDLLKDDTALFKKTKWKILFSDNFKKSFISLRTLLCKQLVIGFLLKLANGWRPKRTYPYPLCPSLSKIVKLYRVHGLYVICTTDTIKCSKFIQVLRVWDVLALVDIPKLMDELENMVSLCTDSYIELCSKEKHEGDLVVPMTWKISSDFVKYKESSCSQDYSSPSGGSNRIKSLKFSESLLLMKFYSLCSGNVKYMLTACDGKEIELPFELSKLESEVIRFPRSAFVVGRSGTGKTIVSVMKLIHREQHHVIASDGFSSPVDEPYCFMSYENFAAPKTSALRQIFLTVNANLCSSVKDYITRLRRLVTGDEIQGDLNEIKMQEVGDDLSLFSDIPQSFIDIPERHFPLVISLRKFLLMLDGSMPASYFDRFHDIKEISDDKRSYLSHASQQLIRSKEVDFERFYTLYWPSFNMKLTTKLDPALVFTQITSYIKGGRGLGKTYHHEKMDENDYIMLSEMRSSTLSKDEREMIYKIFLDYEKRKQMNGDYDISDLVIDLHRRFRVDGYKGAMVDFVYVDEVQDFTLNQISLLKYICANVQDGYLFCGDTAQTIMKGVSFRFQEIRSMFYREFLGESGKLSDLFELTQNFRTHAGILNLGQSILELLYHFFPLCIDRLIVERSPIYGETPAIIESANEDILGTMFGTGGIGSNCLLTFGAEQVILVRDDLTKREVIDQIGNNALVLTIFESKGLEFKDVLIYNFFKGSPLKQQWRVIYEFMDGQGLLDASLTKFPCFNENKHITLCSELKLLYVAITRTRNRLWIFESMPEFAKPLFDYWKTRNLVQQRKWDLSFISSMQILCKPEEWKIRGQKFFNEGNYQAAILCFKHSGDVYLENWAKAASFQMDGDRKLHTDFQTALNLLSKASEIYEMIGKFESSAICFMKLGYYEKAARIYLEKCQEPMYEDAGDCFMLTSCWSDAALCYAQGQCLSKCMTSCRKGRLVELGWEILKGWPGMVSIDVKVDYLQCCIADCRKFTIVESVVEFVGKFPEDGYPLLIETENYIDASTIERMRGEILGEADLLGRAKHYGKSTKLVLFYVVTQMLWSSDSLGWPLKHFVGLDKHLEKAKSLSQMVSSTFYEYVCFEAEFLFDQSSSFSNSILHFRRAQKFKNVSSEIFAARSILEALLKEEKFEADSKGVFRKQIGVLESSIFQCRVSIQVLMFFWNFWKGRMLSMISFVKSLGSINKSQYESYGNLCMEHFGVIKLDGLDMFIAVNGEASWLKGKDEENFSQLGNKVYMSGLVFKSLAERVLKSEICSMAVRVFEKLKWLLMYSRPKLSFIQRAVLALQLYGISIFLVGFNVGVGGSLGLSEQDLLSAFSPLYFENYMISDQSGANLQDKDAAVRALGTILHENLKYFRDGSRPTKTGWALLLVLTSKQLIEELTWEVRHNSGSNSPWRKFFEQLVDYMRKGYEEPSSLASTFLDAVKHADPQCQLLLIECLLFLGSSCKIGREWFLTSKVTLIDSVFSQESEAYWCALSALPQWFDAQSFNCFFDFILAVVDGLMSPRSDHRHPRLNWYKKSELKSFQFHQSLVLRLVTVAGLICLNSKEHFSKVQDLLRNCCGLLSVLPHRFLVQLWGVKKGRTRTTKCFAHAFAKALETVGNQLVIVHTGNWNNSFMHMKPLIRECNLFQHRKGGNKIPVMVKERLNLVKCKYFPI